MSAAPPALIGPYQVIARLGSGGMAETFIALRRGPGGFEQRVCLKRLRPELEGDPEFIRQFMAEAAVAARLRHANITQILDFGRDGEDYYMALELIEGCDLHQLLEGAGGRLPYELAQYVAIELATALEFAHRGGAAADQDGPVLVHRDVSASNALVSTEGEVKLTDFGIARALAGPKHTRTGIVKGKVPYMAPEYARSGRLDVRADLFSLGVLLYECLCGERPHDGETDLQTLERASRGDHVRLAERAPDLPADLTEIVEQLLEHDPELRFQSAAALLEALLALPAPVRARRELGALVVAVRRQRAAAHAAEAAIQGQLSTELMPQASAGPERALEPEPDLRARTRPTQRALWVLGAALLFASGVLALFLSKRGSAPTAPAPVPAAAMSRPEAAAGGAAPALPAAVVLRSSAGSPAPTAPAAEAAAAPDTSSARSPSRTGTLEVIVLPFGDISIDGRPRGSDRAVVRLPAGEHEVETQSRGTTLKRRVSLRPGQHRQVVFR